MDGKVVDTLLGLLDERVAVDFPRQVLDLPIDFFKSLINRHCSYGNRAVANNPLACLMNIVACREVHQCVTSPVAAPHGFADLLLDSRREGRIADVGVELDEEVAADNHGFGFGMVYVGGQHGATCGHLLTHKLGGYVGLDSESFGIAVLADGDIFHLGGDDTLTGKCHLGNLAPLDSSARRVAAGETDWVERLVSLAHTSVFRRDFGQLLKVVAARNPRFTKTGKTLVDVDIYGRVGIHTARVINIDRSILTHKTLVIYDFNSRCKVDSAHSHAHVGVQCSVNIYFLGTGIAVNVNIFNFHPE